MEKTCWDVLWASADLPDQDRDAWRQVMRYRTQVPDDAVRLARLGWTPHDVLAARVGSPDGPKVYGPCSGDAPSERMAALAALADETMRYHDFYAALANQYRGEYVQVLAGRRDRDGWTYDRIGWLISVSKQRARVIAETGPRGDRAKSHPTTRTRTRTVQMTVDEFVEEVLEYEGYIFKARPQAWDLPFGTLSKELLDIRNTIRRIDRLAAAERGYDVPEIGRLHDGFDLAETRAFQVLADRWAQLTPGRRRIVITDDQGTPAWDLQGPPVWDLG